VLFAKERLTTRPSPGQILFFQERFIEAMKVGHVSEKVQSGFSIKA
jgi:hypothetical protein